MTNILPLPYSRTLYFGVVGNRDYIKKYGEKRPFWEYLDQQPDGWLTSLTYRRKDLPEGKPMIYDCGAWSYKDHEIPPVDSKQVASDYADHAPCGSMVIAPITCSSTVVMWNFEENGTLIRRDYFLMIAHRT